MFKNFLREFPGHPVVRTCAYTTEGPGSFPGWGTKIPQANHHGLKKQQKNMSSASVRDQSLNRLHKHTITSPCAQMCKLCPISFKYTVSTTNQRITNQRNLKKKSFKSFPPAYL